MVVKASVAATLAVGACAVVLVMDSQPRPRTHTITIESMRFQPEALTVASGDTIVWVNRDLVPHTATSKPGNFDSKDIPAQESWTYTIRSRGDFAYICSFHPAMKARLRVR
jgi:plastocyanin